MVFWPVFWGLVFAVAVGLFAVLAVFVSVGSIRDIRALFGSLASRKDTGDDGLD